MTTPTTTPENWSDGDRLAFVEHLVEDAELLERFIREGGTYATYATGWKHRRDTTARHRSITPELLLQVLNTRVDTDQPDDTVRSYLARLLGGIWNGEADSTYGMTGASDWQYDIYNALNREGLIPGWAEGYGLFGEDRIFAERLVIAAIHHAMQQEVP